MKESLELYRVFHAVATCGSFSEAARSLFISQPAVSQAMRQLEEAQGAQLFTRAARGATLTAEGKLLYGYVESALKLLATGERKLESMQSLKAGELRIGAGDTITRHFLLPYIEQFHNEHPEVELQIRNRTSTVLIKQLAAGRFDLAVVNLPLAAEGVITVPCGEIHDIFVRSGKTSRKNASMTWEQLAKQPLIMLEPKSNSRRYVQDKFLKKGIELHPEIELGAYDLLIDLAKIGLGVSCVIDEFTREEIENRELEQIKLRPELPPRQIGICYLSSISLPPAAKAFIDLLTNSNK